MAFMDYLLCHWFDCMRHKNIMCGCCSTKRTATRSTKASYQSQ